MDHLLPVNELRRADATGYTTRKYNRDPDRLCPKPSKGAVWRHNEWFIQSTRKHRTNSGKKCAHLLDELKKRIG